MIVKVIQVLFLVCVIQSTTAQPSLEQACELANDQLKMSQTFSSLAKNLPQRLNQHMIWKSVAYLNNHVTYLYASDYSVHDFSPEELEAARRKSKTEINRICTHPSTKLLVMCGFTFEYLTQDRDGEFISTHVYDKQDCNKR